MIISTAKHDSTVESNSKGHNIATLFSNAAEFEKQLSLFPKTRCIACRRCGRQAKLLDLLIRQEGLVWALLNFKYVRGSLANLNAFRCVLHVTANETYHFGSFIA